MNNGFLENIREYLWNAELLLLIFSQDKKKKEAVFSSSSNLTFWMTLQKSNQKGITTSFISISTAILFAVVINGA